MWLIAFSLSFSLSPIFQLNQTKLMCHVRLVCSDAEKALVYRRCGFAIIKKIVRLAKMNFSRVVSIFHFHSSCVFPQASRAAIVQWAILFLKRKQQRPSHRRRVHHRSQRVSTHISFFFSSCCTVSAPFLPTSSSLVTLFALNSRFKCSECCQSVRIFTCISIIE